jgi:hypothetical protein
MISLRPQDPVPDWISHLAFVRDGRVTTGAKQDVLASIPSSAHVFPVAGETSNSSAFMNESITQQEPKVLVDMKNINVQYQDRKVLPIPPFTSKPT